MFAFALYDEAKNDWLIARDPIGIIPSVRWKARRTARSRWRPS
jgi:hypothetical protein